MLPPRRWSAGILFVAGIFVLTGCSGIPNSGSVQQGSAIAAADTSSIQFLPDGPIIDGTKEQILRGFVEASSGPQNDYAIAREFLTPGFATEWDPNSSVRIDAGARTVSESDNSAQLVINQVATVDAMGSFFEPTSAVNQSLDYSFELVDGQWRISQAPTGVVIDRFTFEQVYATHSLYFFDPTFSTLVPDLRWFPNSAATSTRIMKALLAGPSSWLGDGGAVVSAFPQGTQLVADAVPVTKGVATVDLTAQALEAGQDGMRAMQQQATASLKSVSSIASVALSVEGVPQVASGGVGIESVMPAELDSRALVLKGEEFGFLNSGTVAPIDKLSAQIVQLQPSAVSLAPAQRMAAVLAEGQVVLVRSVGSPLVIDSRPGLIAPSVDQANYIWSVPAENSTALQAIATDGTIHEIEVPWTEQASIVSLKISRDGARVLALLNEGGNSRLVVCAIIRAEKSLPVRLGTPVELTAAAGVPIDVAWVDSLTVVSVARNGEGTSTMSQVIGGRYRDLATIMGAPIMAVSGSNSVSQVRALNSEGTLWSLRVSGQWVPSSDQIQVLGTQQ